MKLFNRKKSDQKKLERKDSGRKFMMEGLEERKLMAITSVAVDFVTPLSGRNEGSEVQISLTPQVSDGDAVTAYDFTWFGGHVFGTPAQIASLYESGFITSNAPDAGIDAYDNTSIDDGHGGMLHPENGTDSQGGFTNFPYRITAGSSINGCAPYEGTGMLKIYDVAPVVTITNSLGTDTYVGERWDAKIHFVDPGGAPDGPASYLLDWGDGSDPDTITGNGGADVTAGHVYLSDFAAADLRILSMVNGVDAVIPLSSEMTTEVKYPYELTFQSTSSISTTPEFLGVMTYHGEVGIAQYVTVFARTSGGMNTALGMDDCGTNVGGEYETYFTTDGNGLLHVPMHVNNQHPDYSIDHPSHVMVGFSMAGMKTTWVRFDA